MTVKETNNFEGKDSIKLSLIYIIGVQFILPILVSFAFTMAYADLALQDQNLFLDRFLGPIQFVVFLIATVLLVWLYRYQIKNSYKKFMVNFVDNMKLIFKYYLIAQVFNIILSLFFVEVLKIDTTSQNQMIVEDVLSKVPLLMAIVTVFFAPIIEEIVFRGGLFLGIRNALGEFPAVLISSVTFGAIHVLPQLGGGHPLEILFILPYSLLGYYMVKSVQKTDSLMGGIAFHFVNNLIATVLVLFL